MNKILIIAGGGTKHLEPFLDEANKLGVELTIASFSDLEYLIKEANFKLTVKGVDCARYNLVYIRLVGKRYEDVSLLASFAKKYAVKLVDSIYEKSQFIRLPLAKSLEAKLLLEAGLPVPNTLFARLDQIKEKAAKTLGFPFVIKGTLGKQGHAVWSPRNEIELNELIERLKDQEKNGGRFLAQEFVRASQRTRVLVIGGKATGAITRPTRWRKRFIEKIDGEYPPGKREALKPLPEEDARIAVEAAKSLSIDIAGVDILHEDKTGKFFVLEVNSAPRWESISKDCGINVEAEIVSFLISRIGEKREF